MLKTFRKDAKIIQGDLVIFLILSIIASTSADNLAGIELSSAIEKLSGTCRQDFIKAKNQVLPALKIS